MSVLKRGKRYWIDFRCNGRRYRKSSPDNSYAGARAYEAMLRQKLARGEPLKEEQSIVKKAFGDVALQWLEICVKNNQKQSEYINRRYILTGDLIPYFGKKYIDEITSYDIEQYKNYALTERGISAKTINNRLCILSRCLKTAIEWKFMDTLPKMQKMRVPPQKYDYLTETEADLLLNHSAGMWHDMILLDIRTGLRFGELIGLRWEDVDMKERVLVVNQSIVRDIIGSPKSNKARVIPITDSVVQLLQDRRHNGEYVFHDESGSPLKYDVCRRKLLRICEVAGLRPISWHKLRHSFATHLSNKRNPIVDIKELLGHSDIKTTMRYVHTNLNALTGTINSLENG